MGHAGTLVEVNDRGLSVGSELALGGAGGGAGLQWMAATQLLAALGTVAAVDVELADDGLAWNLGLELLIELAGILDDVAAALGTFVGQRGVEGFVDFGGRRRQAMAVLAMLDAFLATGLLGRGFGWALGERGGLPFGGTFGFFEAFEEVADGLLELVDESIALRELFAELLNLSQ